MNDYISREAVWEMLEKAHIISNGEYSGYCAEDIFIDDIPSADVQPVKRGHWFLRGGNLCCSYCNKKTLLILESNIGGCKWNDLNERQATITKHIDEMYRILTDAKVNYVSQLVGKPVEVTIEDNTFKDFRILIEVL